MIFVITLFSLFAGLFYGLSEFDVSFIAAIGNHTDLILYVLMFTVGISLGMQRGIVSKIRNYHFKIFIIPIGVIVGSFVGGILCSLLFDLPIGQGAAVASGMGWYSLAGATISQMAGAELGSIAFISNLMREIFSFVLIPFLAVKLNYYTCIAFAGATSEDTTLPMMLKYTNEETVMLSVFNGVICSVFVPLLIPFCFSLL